MAKRYKKPRKVYNPSRKKNRKENRSYRRVLKQQRLAKLEKLQQRNQNVNSLNKAFDFAKTKYGGSKAFAMYLSVLLQQVMGVGYDPKAGDSNEYFEIDASYTGKETELFKYIKFKKLPESDKIDRLTERILSDDLASPENYEAAQDKIHRKIYDTNTDNQQLDVLEGKQAQILYDIMNSSSAWNVAMKNASDSDQVLENWSVLHLYAEEAVKNMNPDDTNLLNKIIQKIENEEDIDKIIDFLDQETYKMLGE